MQDLMHLFDENFKPFACCTIKPAGSEPDVRLLEGENRVFDFPIFEAVVSLFVMVEGKLRHTSFTFGREGYKMEIFDHEGLNPFTPSELKSSSELTTYETLGVPQDLSKLKVSWSGMSVVVGDYKVIFDKKNHLLLTLPAKFLENC